MDVIARYDMKGKIAEDNNLESKAAWSVKSLQSMASMLEKDSEIQNFIKLIKNINSLPQVTKCSRLESRSLYGAISTDLDVTSLEQEFEKFFSPIQKPAGKKLPLGLKLNKTVRLLGGIRKDQTFFMKKIRYGEIYGALWPWQSNPQNITILFGFSGNSAHREYFNQLEKIVDSLCM